MPSKSDNIKTVWKVILAILKTFFNCPTLSKLFKKFLKFQSPTLLQRWTAALFPVVLKLPLTPESWEPWTYTRKFKCRSVFVGVSPNSAYFPGGCDVRADTSVVWRPSSRHARTPTLSVSRALGTSDKEYFSLGFQFDFLTAWLMRLTAFLHLAGRRVESVPPALTHYSRGKQSKSAIKPFRKFNGNVEISMCIFILVCSTFSTKASWEKKTISVASVVHEATAHFPSSPLFIALGPKPVRALLKCPSARDKFEYGLFYESRNSTLFFHSIPL